MLSVQQLLLLAALKTVRLAAAAMIYTHRKRSIF